MFPSRRNYKKFNPLLLLEAFFLILGVKGFSFLSGISVRVCLPCFLCCGKYFDFLFDIQFYKRCVYFFQIIGILNFLSI